MRTGVPYSVATGLGSASALGTVFMVKVESGRAYVCICHGRLKLTGAFPEAFIAAEHHKDVFLGGRLAPAPAGPEGSLAGHSDAESATLESFLRPGAK